jgi:hypothetical protein
MSENCAETHPSFPLTPAGKGHRPLCMVLMGLSADPLAKKLVALKAIAIDYRRLGRQKGNTGQTYGDMET